ncbi:hypothetical protein HOLleu_07173 [Holothuria leucospilota]|uniref:Death domain-containing protein n=1 Tax=Holothuria leucospilota TaxID=206669 RepID=A0A9Q1HFW8_HOLLE|nr:hypothetical protein HOLleu_07173 [Holothuria leucospilota]
MFKDWKEILQRKVEKYSNQDRTQSRKNLCKMVKNIMGGEEDSNPERLVTDDYRLLLELSKLLDIEDSLDRDWQMLADKLGFKASEIELFELNKDPTIGVLRTARQKGTQVTAEMLITIFKDLGRNDAATVVQDWQNNGCKMGSQECAGDQIDSQTSTFTIEHYKVFQKLKRLDSENVLGNDYRELGSQLDFSMVEIEHIAKKSKSKTQEILKIACRRGKLKSYEHLIKILRSMKRVDMAQEIEQLRANGCIG